MPVAGASDEVSAIRQDALKYFNKPLLPTHDLPKNLDFSLRPPQDQIPHIYRKSDCWIVSSITEGFGMPGLEAAACRCPVVTTRCGGPEDYVQDGVSGYLVPVGDAQDDAEHPVAELDGTVDAHLRGRRV